MPCRPGRAVPDPAASLPPDEREPRSAESWAGDAANDEPADRSARFAADEGAVENSAVVALAAEVRALREQLAALTAALAPAAIAPKLDRLADRLADGVAARVTSAIDERRAAGEPSEDRADNVPRWGSVSDAAAVLGVSRDTIDRMRHEQRREGWSLPGDPVQVGTGQQRRRERWDLDRVAEWAAAFREMKAQARVRPAVRRSTRRRSTGGRPKPATGSLYARAKAEVAALDRGG